MLRNFPPSMIEIYRTTHIQAVTYEIQPTLYFVNSVPLQYSLMVISLISYKIYLRIYT